ncbi:hypothetical protein O3P69_006928 [Scylla paramamosain]|uniref:Telomeric single stranded DNA binding POT1/Cdc13 domain-containing protein n=1 Tax=Scylla paramamosain TaxID=85552 RepID=A0AAW0U1L0_SCYPA
MASRKRKPVTTHFKTSLSLQKVVEFLPAQHRLFHPGDFSEEGLLSDDLYFVGDVVSFSEFRKRKDKPVATAVLRPVLQDGSKEVDTVKCVLTGPFFEELKRPMNRGSVMWVVLHNPYVFPRKETSRKLKLLMDTMFPSYMWVLVLQEEDSDSSSESLFVQRSLPRDDQGTGGIPTTSHAAQETPTVVSARDTPSTSRAQDTLTSASSQHIPTTAKHPAKFTSSPSKCSATHSLQPSTSFTTNTTTNTTNTTEPPRQRSRRLWPTLKMLSEAKHDQKLCSIGVVVEVVKAGKIAINTTPYDIVRITDECLNHAPSSQTCFNVKIFHNDFIDWKEGGEPKRGCVMVLMNMKCDIYNDMNEGIIYCVNDVCVYKQSDDGNDLKFVCHNSCNKSPHNELVTREVRRVLSWWEEMKIFFFLPPPYPALPDTDLQLVTINEINPPLPFTINGKVMKKEIFSRPGCPIVVLRVFDGTPTAHNYEELPPGRHPVENIPGTSFSGPGSLEVNIMMVFFSRIPPLLQQLQEIFWNGIKQLKVNLSISKWKQLKKI